MPIQYPGNSITKEARPKAGGGFESAIENAAPAAQRVITRLEGGLGAGPEVVLFDRATGNDGSAVSLDADIGQWTGENTQTSGAVAGAKYYAFNGRTWITGRKIESVNLNQKDLTGMRYEHPTKFNKFFRSWRVVIPTGFKMPGAAEPNQKAPDTSGSIWKMDWASLREYGYVANNDIVIPTIVNGYMSVAGNAIKPEAVGTGGGSDGRVAYSYENFSAVNENLFSYYCSGDESTADAADATIETVQQTNGVFLRTVHPNCDPWASAAGGPPQEPFIDTFLCNGWIDNGNTDFVGVLPIFADQYVALGDNCAARIYTHDAPTLAGSNKVQLVPPDYDELGNPIWSDTEIRFTPADHENLEYCSIITSDLTLLENV